MVAQADCAAARHHYPEAGGIADGEIRRSPFARLSRSTWRDLGWARCQLRRLLRQCRTDRPLPLRSVGPQGDRAPSLAGMYRRGLAWLSPRCETGPALWLSGLWSL